MENSVKSNYRCRFVIGYGFDNNEKLWKVYQNNERGMKAEWTFENEEEALENYIKSKISVQNNKLNKVFKNIYQIKHSISGVFDPKSHEQR